MRYKDIFDYKNSLKGIAGLKDGGVDIINASVFREQILDRLIFNAVFNEDKEIKGNCRWLIKSAALSLGLRPASIQELYEAMGRGEYKGFTVPAINIRGLSYDVARAVVRASKKNNMGAFIFEIAKSEIGYTEQSPAEYSTVMIASALREGYKGPIFIQGDHYQISAKKYAGDKNKELSGLKKLIKDSISAGFYNIDIDSSTMVDLSKADLKEQQGLNFEIAADMTAYIRGIQPHGINVSVGGEIGEVGGKNSTVEELRVFMDNYRNTLKNKGNLKGISKISVQTGTTHGGVPLPDGSIAKIKLDFDTLEKLSKVAREGYGLSGAVQHGASTLPDEAFDRFPKTGTAEIHLATGFQNMIYESRHLPADLREDIYRYLRDSCASEKKANETDEQFIYKTRKKGFGPFKEKIWTLSSSIKEAIGRELEEKFVFLFKKLNVVNTYDVVNTLIKPINAESDLKREIEAC
ncbi:MAG: aldolase [Nitrospinae bacterium RIFCSPLOWO2_02_FULL_39_110]|nr:MAG: aldolase [Nitrospinae bacterium RIFCSPHIGHO2_12_FULL_39_42]OGW02549.1 MAG: aldolase [Nitrospinae bacterium RIFCSPHIGHO2_02_FULL_39_82]OGW07144.1 MAG: aldolase [Nitrospinae bacterium RIFCSPLOWO2_02_FULL_39_110]OGW07180.1 MAG: aldolase [Nitrospinae bacterium RIFCSPLOWO2_02_39_17]OGW11716.1 MAG: aldolase [Nitrospinae bacterium RIFCSPLOWO2_12_39_15]OGW12423.1 MAG: aldolase [Nitrospinae bacterium RIFCSPLOWO2_12_FULL_39_93]HLA48504.1 class II fructose-bisphosphate aldolase [Nitrospinota bac